MALASNGNNFTPQVLGRPQMSPGGMVTQPQSSVSPQTQVTAPVASSQSTLNNILGNSALTPQQKQQQIQAAGLGLMPIIYGNQSGSMPGSIAGGAAPAPKPFTPNFDPQVAKLYGANPLSLLGGGAYDMNSALKSINQNRAAFGSALMNNNGMGQAGTFSPVVTGAGQNTTNPLGSLFAALNILGANRSNNYTS